MYRRICKTTGFILKGILVFALFSYVILFLSVHFKKVDVLKAIKEKRNVIRILVENTRIEKESSGVTRIEHLHEYGGQGVEYEYRAVANRSRVWTLKYDNFRVKAPLFYSNRSRSLFFKNVENAKRVGSRVTEELRGEIHEVRGGTYSSRADCGYRANASQVYVNRSVDRAAWFNKVVPIYTPEAWAFQHFMDGALPKIIQVLHILKDPNVTLLLERPPRDKIIHDILAALGIPERQIQFKKLPALGADYFYYTCITPPTHPALWQTARRQVGVPETLQVAPRTDAYVVFVTRKGCHNCGRVIRNEQEVTSLLERRYGRELVRVFAGGLNLRDTIDMFSRARVVLGSHGGGMYNINFAPINTTVVEFMPTHPDGRMDAASKMIIWSQAGLLGQVYWRVALNPIPGTKGDMVVDLEELAGILNVTDSQLR